MKNFSNLVQQRRSMRKFTDENISNDDMKLILRAALMSPSSKGLHGYEFAIIDNPETLKALSTCKDRGAEFLADAKIAIVVMGDKEVSDVWIEDASVASTMIMLQAEDLNIGSCWIQVRNRKDVNGNDAEDNVRKIINMPEKFGIVSIIALGKKGMERKPQNEERLLWDKIHRLA